MAAELGRPDSARRGRECHVGVVERLPVRPRLRRGALAGSGRLRASVSVLHGIEIDGVSDERLASLRAQQHARAAKVVTVYEPLDLGGLSVRTASPRASSCSGRRGHSATASVRPRSPRARHVARRDRGGEPPPGPVRGDGAHLRRGEREAAPLVPADVGDRSVHARLHDALVARRRAARRAAPRDARAAVLRVRVGPVGGGLHGGSGSDGTSCSGGGAERARRGRPPDRGRRRGRRCRRRRPRRGASARRGGPRRRRARGTRPRRRTSLEHGDRRRGERARRRVDRRRTSRACTRCSRSSASSSSPPTATATTCTSTRAGTRIGMPATRPRSRARTSAR